MTIEEFSRAYNLPASTVRRVVATTPKRALSGVGVEVDPDTTKGPRPRVRVARPHLLRRAVVVHVGPGALSADTLERLARVAYWALDSSLAPAGASEQDQAVFIERLRQDAELLRALIAAPRTESS